ncbi:MAG: 1,4-alpha-glucan branching protein GlgB [Marinobacter sp.]|nr:1,4-alpha-glucan branching protein GlgB [Marinobacter sp.]
MGPKQHPDHYHDLISDYDLHLFAEGRHFEIHRLLGAHHGVREGTSGCYFAIWAPNARAVCVLGDFNHWQVEAHPMQPRGQSGVWITFIPGITPGALYKFAIQSDVTGAWQEKTDPYGQEFECRPSTAARVPWEHTYPWADEAWQQARGEFQWQQAPLSIYEVHLGSWRRCPDGRWLGYRELAHQLVDYVRQLGFTHIELLPVTEHPLDESWGYQTTGYFAATSRFGNPDDLRYFVDYCHQHGIGVILDWAPGHFPRDDHGLARFDGTALYEHEDPRQGEHPDWGTLVYNFGRNEVRNFLLASALFWLDSYHMDGLRVDAVASMLYLNYSREPGQWLPNRYGGHENLEAIDFLRELNSVCQTRHPGTLMIAEESTSWPQVTRPPWVGGLGFTSKWNMGWMHDTLNYLRQDPVHRQFHHDKLTFGLLYAFSENFLLPLSHDEVVHGKGSLINKMPGDAWQQRANLRLLLSYMYAYPGGKLLFMGGEFGQYQEWDALAQLDWGLLDHPGHRGLQHLVSDLNRLYRAEPALHQRDYQADGFQWIDCHDTTQSVISFLRRSDNGHAIVVINFTPVVRHHYRVGVPAASTYQERLNSDAAHYGGSNQGNLGQVTAEAVPWMGYPCSLELTLPPLAALILVPEQPHVAEG